MKPLSTLAISILLTACSASTEQQLTEAVRAAEQVEFAQAGEQVEDLLINEVEYSTVSLREMYSDQQIEFIKHRTELGQHRLATMEPTEANLKILEEENKSLDKRSHRLDSLKNGASTSHTIYKVTYQLEAKTDKGSYSSRGVKYFDQASMKEVQ